MSLNNEKNCCEISDDKIAVCKETAGLQSGNFSDLNSAFSKVLVSVKIFQFQDMGNENRFRGHSEQPKVQCCIFALPSVAMNKLVKVGIIVII